MCCVNQPFYSQLSTHSCQRWCMTFAVTQNENKNTYTSWFVWEFRRKSIAHFCHLYNAYTVVQCPSSSKIYQIEHKQWQHFEWINFSNEQKITNFSKQFAIEWEVSSSLFRIFLECSIFRCSVVVNYSLCATYEFILNWREWKKMCL